MAADHFHLAWFIQDSSIQAWGHPWTGNISEDWMSAEIMVDLTRSIERASFDYMLIEDSIYIGETWQNSRDIYLKNGMDVPRQEPSVVATLMLAATQHVGVIPTLSMFAYHPYLVARMVGTMDQTSGGRAGWNAVTGSSDLAAQNFGMEKLATHDLRYDIAEDYLQIVTQLWDSWEPGAIIADRETGLLVDPSKVHTIDYKGQYYSSRGPLNSGPCPQGRPVIAQAGASPRGRAFGAKFADTIVGFASGVEGMKEYRADIRRLMALAGRDPESCKVLFQVTPVICATMEEAKETAAMSVINAAKHIDIHLAHFGWMTNIDFSKFDLDAPVGELTTQGSQSSLDSFMRKHAGKTLREAIIGEQAIGGPPNDLVGTPDSVAAQMAEMMQEIGGDGFMFMQPHFSRRSVAEIIDGLVPVLQQRGLTRKGYSGKMLRDNLFEF